MEQNLSTDTEDLGALVDRFYEGSEAFYAGKSEADIRDGLCPDERRYWLSGFHSAARRSTNPAISVEEYDKVVAAAETACREDIVNPFNPDTDVERNEISSTVYADTSGASGFDEFEVLGTPRTVVRFA